MKNNDTLVGGGWGQEIFLLTHLTCKKFHMIYSRRAVVNNNCSIEMFFEMIFHRKKIGI